MTRGKSRPTLPLRLWLALALVVIVGAPALTTWALSTALAPGQASGEPAAAATVRGLLEGHTAQWHDPAWQRQARQRLAALHVDVLLEDTAGRQVFATPGAPALLRWWTKQDRLPSFPALRFERATDRPPLPRFLLPLMLFQTRQAGMTRSPASMHTKVSPAPVGLAYVWLPPSALTPTPPAWLVPLAGLAALLVALTAVAWGLGRLVLRPLAAMSQAAEAIAGGNLDVRLPPSRAREVAEVAAALAGMSASLREALHRQTTLEEERRLFIGAIAHDLHTPLFVLRGYLQGLENGVATTPRKVAAYVAECRARVDAMARLIADLFAYTRVEYLEQSLQPEPFDLGALLRQTADGWQPLASEKDVMLVLDGPDAPCPLLGDHQLLTRAVENLLDNALRHTPAGGEVRMSWGMEGQSFVVQVADTGSGIAAEDLPHLFTPLYRGESSRNRQTGGAGLGLAIARRIVHAHGGDLTAANRATGGAVFTATLPVAGGAPAPSDAVTATVS